jgi:hypothetical protein
LRVNRSFDGDMAALRSRTFRCNVGGQETRERHITTEIAWRLGVGFDCDESMPVVPNSFISARGTTILRDDSFAHFNGRLTITFDPNGPQPVLLFTGRLDLIGRIGSHQFLGEQCDQGEHFEGWLEAQGQGPLARRRLRCVVVGHGVLPDGVAAIVPNNRIIGTLFPPP